MFNNKRSQENASITVIASGSLVQGTLRVKGMLQVDGTVDGTLVAEGHVSVGPEGRISGDLEAEALSLGGCVEGNVKVRGHLHLLASGRLQGEARYDTLEVDRGGIMDGRTSRLGEEADAQRADNDVTDQATKGQSSRDAVDAVDAAE